ncbi:MAG TPA: hypothetical protein VGP36_20615 [Mycobacteriales bacterium]|jgi:hypothetical protein|nr:hypothetical protein [Mycobacteriales bacterium]
MEFRPPDVSRRTLLKAGAALALFDGLTWIPARPALAATTLPDVQFDIGAFIAPATSVDGVQVQFGPVHTHFLTANLKRVPTAADQAAFANALDTIESAYEFSPAGVFVFVSYGLSYFSRLPGGLNGGSVSANHIPRLIFDSNRFALEEAKAAPTDAGQPGIVKRKFDIAPQIGGTDVLFTIRSDDPVIVQAVSQFLRSTLSTLNGQPVTPPKLPLTWTTIRAMVSQRGYPRTLAAREALYYADRINDDSPMWMGFADQHTAGSGPAAAVTFAGNASSRLSNARAGDYFDNGSIQHLSHLILDLEAFYARVGEAGAAEDETYLERVQYMFRSDPPPSFGGGGDPFENGGGPAYLPNTFQGIGDAALAAQGVNTPGNVHRIGHVSALQQSSRAADGTPLHIRMDGIGYDTMDVPDIIVRPGKSGNVPKLQFTAFVPTADFFDQMRRSQAALNLQTQFVVDPLDNGLERFLTATRRQNFLVPPRRHRAFPLVELA